MSPKILKLFTVSLILALSISVGSATVEWEILNTIKLDAPPLDVAVFPNGKYIFILTRDGSVRIYDLEGRQHNQFKVGEQVLDFVIAGNGRSVIVLSENGRIHMYSLNGRLRNKMDLGKQIDQIKLGPKGERLFATDRHNQTIEVITLDLIENISIEGAPFKGPQNAPVVIAEFSDFE